MKWFVYNRIQNDFVVFVSSENQEEKQYKQYNDFLMILQENCNQKILPSLIEFLNSYRTVFVDLINQDFRVIPLQELINGSDNSFETLVKLNTPEEIVDKDKRILEKSKEFLHNIFVKRSEKNGWFNND